MSRTGVRLGFLVLAVLLCGTPKTYALNECVETMKRVTFHPSGSPDIDSWGVTGAPAVACKGGASDVCGMLVRAFESVAEGTHPVYFAYVSRSTGDLLSPLVRVSESNKGQDLSMANGYHGYIGGIPGQIMNGYGLYGQWDGAQPSLIYLGNDQFLAAWTGGGLTNLDPGGTYIRRIEDSNGTPSPMGSATLISQYFYMAQPLIIANPSAGFALVIGVAGDHPQAWALVGYKIDLTTLSTIGGEILVDDFPFQAPYIVPNGAHFISGCYNSFSQKFIVAWAAEEPTTQLNLFDLWVRELDANGTPGTKQQLTTYGTGVSVHPSVACNNQDGSALLVSSREPGTSGARLIGHLIDANGSISPEIAITNSGSPYTSAVPGEHYYPSVVYNALSGTYFLTFSATSITPNGHFFLDSEIFGQALTQSGYHYGPAFQISDMASLPDWHPFLRKGFASTTVLTETADPNESDYRIFWQAGSPREYPPSPEIYTTGYNEKHSDNIPISAGNIGPMNSQGQEFGDVDGVKPNHTAKTTLIVDNPCADPGENEGAVFSSDVIAATAGYLYGSAATSLNLNPFPLATNELCLMFTVDPGNPVAGVKPMLHRFGSEFVELSLWRVEDDQSRTLLSSTGIDGGGEEVSVAFEDTYQDPLPGGTYELCVSYVGGGLANGCYVDRFHVAENVGAARYDVNNIGSLARFTRDYFAQIGTIDSYSANPDHYSDEFLQGNSFVSLHQYDFTNNPDDEVNAPAIPAVISTSAVPGKTATQELRFTYQSAKAYSPGALFTLRWYGTPSSRAKIYHDGKYMLTTNIGPKPTLVQTNVLLRNLSAGTHEIRILAEAGTTWLDSMYIVDQRTDIDNDGLADNEELILGTDTNKADSDKDGVDDWLEVAMGSNPLDKKSLLLLPLSGFNTGINSFLGMVNIEEIRNVGETAAEAWVSLLDMNGQLQDRRSFIIPARGQFDVLAHELRGFSANSIGNMTVEHAASPGTIQTQVVYYKPSTARTRSFDFAFANSSFALPESQYLPINTFYPSFNSAIPLGETYNWLELSHAKGSGQNSGKTHAGTLQLFDSAGNIKQSLYITLEDGARRDIDAHSVFGPSAVGFAAWLPEDDASYTFKNSRYFYDAARSQFISAYQLTAQQGSSETLLLPIETKDTIGILEIANTVETENPVEVTLYTKSGEFVATKSATLGKFATLHIIANEYQKLQQAGLGLALARGEHPINATSMTYKVDGWLNVLAVSGVPGKATVAKVQGDNFAFNASYNTFLNQSCNLVLLNGNNSAITPQVKIYSAAGALLHSSTLSVPKRGALSWNPCQYAPVNTYGNVEILQSRLNAHKPLVGWLYRVGNSYYFPTSVE